MNPNTTTKPKPTNVKKQPDMTPLVTRHFSTEGKDPFDNIQWEKRTALVGTKEDPIFIEEGVEVPEFWSQNLTNIVASKYFAYTKSDSRREKSVRTLIERVVNKIVSEGEEHSYLTKPESLIFRDELKYILVHQMASFNSPVWFNIGVEDEPQQASACFILDVEDNMNSISRWYSEETKIFKGGSGAGLNISKLRSANESLSKGGYASGPVSFMRGADATAGTIKSGGRTRRSAKLVCMDVSHPDIEEFVDCKVREEERIRILADAGIDMGFGDDGERNLAESTSYQNANNSVRVTDEFMEAVEANSNWDLLAVQTGEPVVTIKARELMKKIARSAWICADPGLQYDTTINNWHTTPAQGPIQASNPCCFTGDTLVDTSEGKISFKELYDSFAKYKDLKVFAYDLEDNLPSLVDISKVWISGKTSNLVEVTTDKGIKIRCTPEHRFLTFGGKYVKAKDLKKGDRLRKIGRLINENRSSRNYINHRETSSVKSGTICQSRFMWEQAYGPIPQGKEVHHINEDPTDDRLSNFELSDRLSHRSFHSKGENNNNFLAVENQKIIEIWEAIEKNKGSVTVHKWNDYIEKNNLKNQIPLANINGIRGKTWGEFSDWVESQRSLVNDRIRSVKFISLKEPVEVYDLESPSTSNFSVTSSGNIHSIVVHNSEYMSNNNTACNLASLNLKKFFDSETFLAEDYEQAIRIMFSAQDITISFADFPTPKIAKNTVSLRQIGLGYSNTGALLMSQGLAYDSDAGRNLVASLTSLLTATAYNQSAAIAKRVGSFPYFEQEENRKAMIRVLGKHRDANKDLISENQSSSDYRAEEIATAGQRLWQKTIRETKSTGIRNAQATVLAPCGTISFFMDCDTTGIEPDFALIKRKELSGGGTMDIVNQSLYEALSKLDYQDSQIEEIIEFVSETDPETGSPRNTVSNAPHLRREHYSVFDCAVGEREVSPIGHIKMVAAVQPFLSGAVSKTVNVPSSYTADDIMDIYIKGWEMGTKSISIYRDGSKAHQPLNVKKKKQTLIEPLEEVEDELEKIKEGLQRGERREVATDALLVGYDFKIASTGGYIHVRLFDDGTPGAIFLDVGQAGSALHGFIRAWAVTMSLALQYGMPLDHLVRKLAWTQFEPAGITNDPDIRLARSIVDYIMRWLAKEFLDESVFEELGIRIQSETAEIENIPGENISPKSEVHAQTKSASSLSETKTIPLLKEAKPFGKICQRCGGNMIPNGACHTCTTCGDTDGCG